MADGHRKYWLAILLGNWLCVGAGSAVKAPSTFYASQTGARQDSDLMKGGGSDDTAALQRILDQATRSHPIHLIVDGAALVSGLSVRGNTTLECKKGGGFYLKDGSERAVLRNAHRSRDEIIDDHISVRGCFFNGNRDHQVASIRGPDGFTVGGFLREADGTYKMGVQFAGVRDLQLESVTIYNSRSFGASISNADHVAIRSVRVDTGIPPDPSPNNLEEFNAFKKKYWTNNDGIDVHGPAQHVTIDGADLRSSDDAIALLADDSLHDDMRKENDFGPYVASGPITDVQIKNVYMRNVANGVRLLSRNQPIDRVSILRVRGNVYSRFFVLSGWIAEPKARGKIGHVAIADIDVAPIANPNAYETCESFRCGDEFKAATPAQIRFYEEDFEYPVFSFNTSIASVKLSNVRVHVSDNRPIVRVGAYADIGTLSLDVTMDDPKRVGVPILFAPGGQVKSMEAGIRSADAIKLSKVDRSRRQL